MFEKIVLRRSENGDFPTPGEFAEALLFYQRVHIILDRSSVLHWIKKIGFQRLLELLRRTNVSAVYCRETLCTLSTPIGALTHHNFAGFDWAGSVANPEKRFTPLDSIQELLRDTNQYSNRQARRQAEKFFELVPIRSLMGNDFMGHGVNLADAARSDLDDQIFATQAFYRTIEKVPGFPGFSNPPSFEVIPTWHGFTVVTNIDFERLNAARVNLIPPAEPLTIAHFLTEILMARADLMLASHYGSDFKTSAAGSTILELRFSELLRRNGLHQKQLNDFQEVVVNQGRSLREAIDGGSRTFDEFLELLGKAKLFNNWSSGIHPDSNMVAEYLKEGSRQGWIDSLPSKGLRFVIGATLDSLAPGVGTGYGLADALFLDRLGRGWRPSHFVEHKLQPFVND